MKPLTKPFCGLFPPLSTEEREALRISVVSEGVRNACLATEDGRLLDGHARLEIEPAAPVVSVVGSAAWSDDEAKAFVYRLNRARRKMSPDQRREVRAAEIATAISAGRVVLSRL